MDKCTGVLCSEMFEKCEATREKYKIMNNKLKLPAALVPYSGVIYFVVILMVSHFVWKLTVLGDESDLVVTFAGYDISAPFNFMA